MGARSSLLAAYVASLATALANPADLDYGTVYALGQAANVATLALLGLCRGGRGELALAGALAAGMALTRGSRWDSALLATGAMAILQDGFLRLLPAGAAGRAAVYALFFLVVFPALTGLPHLLRRRAVDDATVLRAADMATLAYAPPAGVTAFYDEATDTTAILVAEGADAYLAFAGTVSRRDWATNVNVLSRRVAADWACAGAPPDMKAHRGFARALASVAPRVLEALRAAPPAGRLVVCGHSLGGALATLAGAWVGCQLPDLRPRVCVVTFGAPQAGDARFVDFFNDVVPASARLVAPLDPVPRSLSAQLVHVKGYVPAGTWSPVGALRAHSMRTYRRAAAGGRTSGVVAAFVPAVLAAGGTVAWLAWLARA